MAMLWSMGEWCEETDFTVSSRDRALLHGLAAFETMLAIDGVIQHEARHRRRMARTVDALGLADVSGLDWERMAAELCEKNGLGRGRARLRLTVTSGEGALAEPGPGAGAMVWMTAQPLAEMASSCRIVTLPWVRNERSALVGMKTTSYAENLLGLQWARARGAEEGIFFNTRDELCEACTANVFVKIDGVWHTPSLASGCLPGVMREVILERDASIKESVITRAEWDVAEEIFLTSAIRGKVRVVQRDERMLRSEASLDDW